MAEGASSGESPPGAVAFDPHWFRRAMHALGAAFVVYYLLPEGPSWFQALKLWGPWVVVAAAGAVEAYRILGGIDSEHFFGLREYERTRVSGYIYFGVAAAALLTLFPQQIAVPCLVASSLGDPLMGEIRRAGGTLATSTVAGGVLAFALFLLVGWTALPAILGGALTAVGEVFNFRWLDDDILMPLLPALALLALAWTGVVPLPPALLHPLGAWP